MLARVIFWILILVEGFFCGLSLWKKSDFEKEKSIVRSTLLVAFLFLVVSPVIDWGFRWFMLGLLLMVQALFGLLVLVRKKEKAVFKKGKVIFSCFIQVILIGMALLPAFIFPQYNQIQPTGEYSVDTKSYTLMDTSRKENFTEEDDNRKVTIQYWYPIDQSGDEETMVKGKFPLVIFSHGAFGYRMSNYSTFQELASHGYIVGSIDHTYHAFMTRHEDGETIMVNMDFMNSAMQAQNGETAPEEIYKQQQEWMKLRTEDMAFVLGYIKEMTASANADTLYQGIDIERIGVFGHSLGGATAAQIGRDDDDVDAVVVVDGTMLGELIGFEDGKNIITDIPYPKPIMNIYNESHYNDAFKMKDKYENMVAYKNALDAYQVVIKGSGHMNFTDLPMISPFLTNLLEAGNASERGVDARYCIETTNENILQFFDRYLKSNAVTIPREKFQ